MTSSRKNIKKTPEELVTRNHKREPLSARVKSDTKKTLEKAAKSAGTSLSDLAAAILDDYADWLNEQGNRKQR